MTKPWTRISFGVVGLLVAGLASSGCSLINLPQLSGTGGNTAVVAQPAPTAAAVPGSLNATSNTAARNQAIVKRDSISQILSLDGLVTAQQQVPVTYPGSGKVLDVKVKPGQPVNKGDQLLELDATEAKRSLDAAQARLQTSKANLAQAQAQLAAQQQTAQQRAATVQQQQQQAVADAQAGLRHAQENLAKVMAGPTDADRQPLQAALAKAQTGLQQAQDAQNKLNSLPDSTTVQKAQNDVSNAQIALQRAKQDLDALTRGPDPLAVAQAQHQVDAANVQLQLAQSAKIDPKTPDQNAAKLQHDQAISDAQLALQQAEVNLAKVQQPPAAVDVQSAQLRVRNAQDALGAATDTWNQLAQPPAQAAQDAAQAAVDSAQQTVDQTQAQLDTVNSHPTPSEVADAHDQVRRAQAALDAARQPVQTSPDPGGVDLGALQQAIASDQADVDTLQKQVDDAFVVSPLTGTVVSVGAKPGDTITSAKPVVVLAPLGIPIVRVELDDTQVKQVAAGQSGTVAIDPGNGGPVVNAHAAVAGVTFSSADTGAGPSVDLNVTWPEGSTPRLGVPVPVNLTVQQKSNALVVPKTAIRQVGSRTYVTVLDGLSRKNVDVQLGITGTDTAEVVSGLNEDQVVLLTP